MFGESGVTPQNETTPMHPRSAYGISKVSGFHLTRNYRESYKIHASTGILFNHESPRRGFEFVTRKITSHVAQIKLGITDKLRLGNLDAKRDWGHARHYVPVMWKMLQMDRPTDLVIGTGKNHRVRDFCEVAFRHVGLDYQDFTVVDEKLYRPAEATNLLADSSLAKEVLDWKYEGTLAELVTEMVDSDLAYFSSRAQNAIAETESAAR